MNQTKEQLWTKINAFTKAHIDLQISLTRDLATKKERLETAKEELHSAINALFPLNESPRKNKSIPLAQFLRAEVRAFAIAMEERLRLKDKTRRDTWRGLDEDTCIDEAEERLKVFETVRYHRARSVSNLRYARRQLVDAANYLLFGWVNSA